MAIYIDADEDLCTCATLDVSDNWREKLRTVVVSEGMAKKVACNEDETDDEDETEDSEPPSSSITTYDQALQLSNDLMLFLTSKGEEQAVENLLQVTQSLQDRKLAYKLSTGHQSSLYEFFTP